MTTRTPKLPIALALLGIIALAAPARAVPWNQVFADEPDTVYFLASNGALWRAPFSLASREVVWTPGSKDERLARVRVSPDGRHVAWISRAGDEDTTHLFIDRPPARTRYFSLMPAHFHMIHFEPRVPTTEDPAYDGARFVLPTLSTRRESANTFVWTATSDVVVFGYNDGIAAIRVDSTQAFQVSRALPIRLASLDPAPMLLADAIVFDASGLQTETSYLLYPWRDRWPSFQSGGLSQAKQWAATENTVWWTNKDGNWIKAVRTSDPTVTNEATARDGITWMGVDDAHHALDWADGRTLWRETEGGATPVKIAATAGTIRAVVEARTGLRALVAGDSLLVWNPKDDSLRGVKLGGFDPGALFDSPSGDVLVGTASDKKTAARLARVSFESGTLEKIDGGPDVKGGVFVPSPSGKRIVLYGPGSEPPKRVFVHDIAGKAWIEVENPGISGWEGR